MANDFKKYPYQDFNAFNLDWIIERSKEIDVVNEKAEQAIDKAAEARNIANAAANTADTANNTANAAQTRADNAYTLADSANTAAGTAQTRADNAYTLADSANTAAGTAQTRADNAYTLADTANTAAGNAQTRADNAYTLAGSANTAAGAAQTRADNAYTLADGIKTKLANILTYGNSSGVEVATSSRVELGNLTLPTAGTYLILAFAEFAYNTSGIRRIELSHSSGGSAWNFAAKAHAMPMSRSSYTTTLQLMYVNSDFNANDQVHLVATQNSGSTLNCKCFIVAQQIA